jgi:hypothetical protein
MAGDSYGDPSPAVTPWLTPINQGVELRTHAWPTPVDCHSATRLQIISASAVVRLRRLSSGRPLASSSRHSLPQKSPRISSIPCQFLHEPAAFGRDKFETRYRSEGLRLFRFKHFMRPSQSGRGISERRRHKLCSFRRTRRSPQYSKRRQWEAGQSRLYQQPHQAMHAHAANSIPFGLDRLLNIDKGFNLAGLVSPHFVSNALRLAATFTNPAFRCGLVYRLTRARPLFERHGTVNASRI